MYLSHSATSSSARLPAPPLRLVPEPPPVARLARAPWNEDQQEHAYEHRLERRFRAAAVHWIYRAARVPAGEVWSVERLVRAVFEEIQTSERVTRNGRCWAPTPDEAATFETFRGIKCPAATLCAYDRWGDRFEQVHVGRRLVLVEETAESMGWGLGVRAIDAMKPRFERFRSRLQVIRALPVVAGVRELPWEVWQPIDLRVANAIGAELVRMYEAGDPIPFTLATSAVRS